jgi:hypothetical protein
LVPARPSAQCLVDNLGRALSFRRRNGITVTTDLPDHRALSLLTDEDDPHSCENSTINSIVPTGYVTGAY